MAACGHPAQQRVAPGIIAIGIDAVITATNDARIDVATFTAKMMFVTAYREGRGACWRAVLERASKHGLKIRRWADPGRHEARTSMELCVGAHEAP